MDEWGPCESREEWLLMFERGLTPQRIATLCRVTVDRVRRAVAKQLRQDPTFFDRCLLVHDQPAYQPPAPPRPPSHAERWVQNYVAIADHVLRTGSLPSQNGGERARALYKWLQYQRALHSSGNLEERRLDALDKIGDWHGEQRGPLAAHWARRLDEVLEFCNEHNRLPAYATGRDEHEKRLASWLGRQRTWNRHGVLLVERAHRLDEALPGWAHVNTLKR